MSGGPYGPGGVLSDFGGGGGEGGGSPRCILGETQNFLTRTSSTIVDFLHAVYGQH